MTPIDILRSCAEVQPGTPVEAVVTPIIRIGVWK
jgi:hypothetical protein